MKDLKTIKTWMANNKTVAAVLVTVIVVLLASLGYEGIYKPYHNRQILTVGFIYDNEPTTPYSYNFYLAQEAIQKEYGTRVRIMMYSNVLEENLSDRMKDLAKNGCNIIFANGYGNIRALADEYPDIQFCQASNDPYPEDEARENYHTFKGEIYQGRYITGVIAGLKLQQMIENGEIEPDQAKIGFVAAFPYTEVISGYTAFLLGARSIVPQTTMDVRYTGSWDNFTQEKARANQLLDEGCMIISQHTDTAAPAIACEEYLDHNVYHIGYNIDMSDVAPHSSLVSTSIDWKTYIGKAVEAMIKHKRIEDYIDGNVHPMNDMSAGFDKGGVEITGLNEDILPEGTDKVVERTIRNLNAGKIKVFMGPYTGVDPADKNKTIDLRKGFVENENSSIPSFGYILDDVINERNTVTEDNVVVEK